MSREDFLTGILREKEREIAALKMRAGEGFRKFPRKEVGENRFWQTLRNSPTISIIAEIKRGSPSRGFFRPDLDPVDLALTYEKHGARALSVLTDRTFFFGEKDFLPAIKRATGLPVLRKDFILDPIQVEETLALGADALLLIARLLEAGALTALVRYAAALGLEPLVEVHSEKDLEKALASGARCLGINNRDLETFTVDLEVTRRLAPLVPPDRVLISESGIKGTQDLLLLKGIGVRAVLVGEYLVTGDPGRRLRDLVEVLSGEQGQPPGDVRPELP